MTPATFRTLRKKLGLTQLEWGRVLGYSGQDETVKMMICRFEKGTRPIPKRTGMMAELLGRMDSVKVTLPS